MRHFVGDQTPPLVCVRGILTGAEDDVVADGVGSGVDVLGGLRGRRICMHAHAGQGVTETLLQVLAQRRIERTTGPRQDALDAVGGVVVLGAGEIAQALYARRLGGAGWCAATIRLAIRSASVSSGCPSRQS